MPNNYTRNPLTERVIRIGGTTFNQLVMDAYDFIDGRLVRRQNAPPPLETFHYFNIDTGRMVRYGTRTYFSLIDARYEFVEDYYLVLSHLVEVAIYFPHILRENPQNAANRLEQIAVERRVLSLEELHRARLEQINIELCRECLMPENPNELADGFCGECHAEK
jgi:hypothetical protein